MLSTKNIALALTVSLVSVTSALPVRREVPQEHSHQQFLDLVKTSLDINNPNQIQDPVFGLLGNAAGSQGQGLITDTDCLQQATADQAFTNAKAAGDVKGMTAALIYRALERNTGKVGQASVPCTSIQAVNPEIAAIQQHQDPASPNAAAINKAITLALAQQIAAIGGDPTDALKSGTFAPGDVNDPTAKGNTCDDANDPVGCIFTQNLLVEDASIDEINAAVASSGSVSIPGVNSCDSSDSAASTSAASAASVTTATSSASATSSAAATATTTAAASGANLQTFTGSLGGAPPEVKAGGRGFVVSGSNDFLDVKSAIQRSCDIQHNTCADAANAGGGFSVNQCDQQQQQCVAANKN